MKKFDTKVQQLKYKVLREVARHAFDGTLLENINNIPRKIVPGKEATMRCCIYMERAIIADRVKLAIGGTSTKSNVIEVIDIACDECPVGGYEISDSCRGCIAHHCESVCRFNAISFVNSKQAYIDKSKCTECGMCAKVCQFNAIIDKKRPCVKACKVKAISISKSKAAYIDDEKCIACGACVYQCPFGAIMDKSFILPVIDMLKDPQVKVYAVVAPTIASQCTTVKLGQVISAIKVLGFYDVVEAALGADMVAFEESKELAEKGDLLTSSCCPAFVDYIHKEFPTLIGNISHNLSPMAAISKYIKETSPDAKVVFIGPCTAKKMEIQKEEVRPYVDAVITFEELNALIDSQKIDMTTLPEDILDNASYFGRIFARSGGLSDAVKQAIKEHGLDDFEFKPVKCDGFDACRTALLKASKGVIDGNFIEGMVCNGGCIGGAGCLTHGAKSLSDVDKYGNEAHEKTITDALKAINITK